MLPNVQVIQDVKDGGYTYLGVLETDQIKQDEMKDKTRTEFLRRVKRVLRSKLNRGNMISVLNISAESLVCYTAGIVRWRKGELWTDELES